MESFNNVALVYIDKRIHFKNTMYLIRIGLAILDWNENIDRPTTSVRHYMQAGMDMDRQGKRVLKPKTFDFVVQVWNEYVQALNQGIAGEGDDDIEEEDIDSDDNDYGNDIDNSHMDD
jgi:hypothetical protein